MFEPKKKSDVLRESFRVESLKVADAARDLLKSESFIRYKQMYEKLEGEMMKALLHNQMNDPVQDAFYMRSLVDKVSVLRILIDNVEKDAK